MFVTSSSLEMAREGEKASWMGTLCAVSLVNSDAYLSYVVAFQLVRF